MLTVNRKDEFYSINLLSDLTSEKQKLTSWDRVWRQEPWTYSHEHLAAKQAELAKAAWLLRK